MELEGEVRGEEERVSPLFGNGASKYTSGEAFEEEEEGD